MKNLFAALFFASLASAAFHPFAASANAEPCNENRFEPAGREFELCERNGNPGVVWTTQYGKTHEWHLTNLEENGTATIEYYWDGHYYCTREVGVGEELNCGEEYSWPVQWITIENLGVHSSPAQSAKSGPLYAINAKINALACDEDREVQLYFDFYLCEGKNTTRVWTEVYGITYEWRLLSVEENGYYEMDYYEDGEFVCRNGDYAGGMPFTCDNETIGAVFYEGMNVSRGPAIGVSGNSRPTLFGDVNTIWCSSREQKAFQPFASPEKVEQAVKQIAMEEPAQEEYLVKSGNNGGLKGWLKTFVSWANSLIGG